MYDMYYCEPMRGEYRKEESIHVHVQHVHVVLAGSTNVGYVINTSEYIHVSPSLDIPSSLQPHGLCLLVI